MKFLKNNKTHKGNEMRRRNVQIKENWKMRKLLLDPFTINSSIFEMVRLKNIYKPISTASMSQPHRLFNWLGTICYFTKTRLPSYDHPVWKASQDPVSHLKRESHISMNEKHIRFILVPAGLSEKTRVLHRFYVQNHLFRHHRSFTYW